MTKYAKRFRRGINLTLQIYGLKQQFYLDKKVKEKVTITMSKRKSRINTMVVDKLDMEFEDDSSNPDLDELVSVHRSKSTGNIGKGSNKPSGSRVSARGKREKKIYDPSDHHGPVHKKKKDSIETSVSLAGVKKTPQKTPVKTPHKTEVIAVKSSKPPATPQSAKRKLDMDKEMAENQLNKIRKVAHPVVPAVKEQSKRIQGRKEKSVENIIPEIAKPAATPLPPPTTTAFPRRGILRKSFSSEHSVQTSSTVPVHDGNSSDVSKWKPNDVSDYFLREGFDKKDAAKFKEQEIDGESLLILQRDDLKNLDLKVGVFIKMWNRILRLQSGLFKFKFNAKSFC